MRILDIETVAIVAEVSIGPLSEPKPTRFLSIFKENGDTRKRPFHHVLPAAPMQTRAAQSQPLGHLSLKLRPQFLHRTRVRWRVREVQRVAVKVKVATVVGREVIQLDTLPCQAPCHHPVRASNTVARAAMSSTAHLALVSCGWIGKPGRWQRTHVIQVRPDGTGRVVIKRKPNRKSY